MEEGLVVLIVKWREAGEHYVQYDANAPIIYFLAVAVTLDYLWSDVARCTTGRCCVFSVDKSGEAEVRNLDV